MLAVIVVLGLVAIFGLKKLVLIISALALLVGMLLNPVLCFIGLVFIVAMACNTKDPIQVRIVR